MKLVLASLLSFLASGAGATSRALQGDDRYHVNSIAVGWGGTSASPDQTTFGFSATHNEATTGTVTAATSFAGVKKIMLFKSCPHGEGPDQSVSSHANHGNYLGTIANDGTGITWIDSVIPPATTQIATSSVYETKWQFKVDATIATATTGVYTATPGNPDKGAATFCIFFGIGDANDIYGFREATVTANFEYNGAFTAVSFVTQAYDPVSGATDVTRSYSSQAANCSPQAADGFKVRPGMPTCIEVCPSGANADEVKVTAINTMNMAETSTTSAPDSMDILAMTTKVVTCNPVGGILNDSAGNAIAERCCRVVFILPARFFPVTTPANSQFQVTGDVDLVPKRRRLQEGSVEEKAPLSGSVEFELIPEGYEESSSSALGLAAAAAGAIGAALLL